ncbi:MAG: APC family permease, partial [Sphingomonadaceae bacterium]
VIQTGSLALLAYVFGDYMAVLVPIGPLSSTVYAAVAVIVVSMLNWAGVRSGATAQRWLTAIEVGGLALVIVAGLLIAPAGAVQPSVTGESALGLMMVFVLLTYGGWSEAAYLSAEVKDGARRIAPMLVLGLTIVTLLYMLANLAFLSVLGLGGMAATDAVAADVMRLAFGDTGGALISLLIAIAAITSANATAITGGRTACALGRSYRGLSWLGQWDDARNTPANGLLAQCVIALLLVGAGALAQDGFRTAIEYTAPVFWGFLLLVGLSLFVLRRREPDRPRPFRVPFYPILPAVFCLTSAYLLYSSLAYTGWGALAGVAVLLGGGILLTFLTPTDNEEFAS